MLGIQVWVSHFFQIADFVDVKGQIYIALFFVIQTTNLTPWIIKIIFLSMLALVFCSFITGHPQSEKQNSLFPLPDNPQK